MTGFVFFFFFRAQDIIKNAVYEIQKQSGGEVPRQWIDEILVNLVVDVQAGDCLKGIRAGDEMRMVVSKSGKELGRVRDGRFTEAFFGIWLSEKTSHTTMREKLMEPYMDETVVVSDINALEFQ